MADFFDVLTDEQIEFVRRQHMFFVATAHASGRVNLSPKGMDTLRVLDERRLGYLDMIGSGNETCAHIQNDGRITLMFCSFDQRPNILRVYGRGEVVAPASPAWDDLIPRFEEIHGRRQIILVHVESTQNSCGYAVPRYEFKSERDTLRRYAEKFSADEANAAIALQTQSIDGLPIRPSAARES